VIEVRLQRSAKPITGSWGVSPLRIDHSVTPQTGGLAPQVETAGMSNQKEGITLVSSITKARKKDS
jgi:hypothetical protein